MNSVFFLILRRMRAPLIVLVLIYAVSILGLSLIPGIDPSGQPTRPMSLFHAFYFISYTATTIGFGEIPAVFSDAQRLWVTACIYLSVVGWTYSILTLLALFQDSGFRLALATTRFRQRVSRLNEPFYLICGCGETGGLLMHALDHMQMRFVVVEINETRINELELEDFRTDAPALIADARPPQTLLMAGLAHRKCLGVLALTNDDGANLAIAIAARLLSPSLPVLCRAETAETAANMASFGVHHIINPYEKFGEYLALAMDAPGCHRLLHWLTGIPGRNLLEETIPPRGNWIVCGYSRFGRSIAENLEREGVGLTIIDPSPAVTSIYAKNIVGIGTGAETLLKAGVESAVGIVAGTDSDVDNLSIVITARELNPKLYVVLRQNQKANKVLFDAFAADLVMLPSETVAHECLAILTAPLLSRFLAVVKRETDAWADTLIERLQARLGNEVPTLWSVRLAASDAPALHRALVLDRKSITLDCLLRHSSRRDDFLACFPLLALREGREQVTPDPHFRLEAGDELLFAGTAEARMLQALTLQNTNVLDYVMSGREIPGGWIWRALSPKNAGSS